MSEEEQYQHTERGRDKEHGASHSKDWWATSCYKIAVAEKNHCEKTEAQADPQREARKKAPETRD